MSRTIVLLDVTAMSGDAVCVAGLDCDSGDTLRLSHPQPTRALLHGLGGLTPGEVIQVDWRPARRPEPPHVEDGDWQPRSVKKLRTIDLAEVLKLMTPQAFTSVESAFGPPWYTGGNGNHAWKPGEGARSLAPCACITSEPTSVGAACVSRVATTGTSIGAPSRSRISS